MRYLPLSDTDRGEMLARTGVNHVDELFADVPKSLLLKEPVDLPRRKGELEVERILSRMSAKNIAASSVPFFVGAGAYKHHVPATVDHLIQRSEFLTSYTPYQPEIAQGTLQYLFEFQTQVAALTGMEVANASMYDGSTGTGEAVLMAHRVTKRRKAVLSGGLHPHYADVVRTLSDMASDEVVTLAPDVGGYRGHPFADRRQHLLRRRADAGRVRQCARPEAHRRQGAPAWRAADRRVHGSRCRSASCKSPGSMGADIVVGEGQSIGNALNFGGPYVGLFATQSKYIRQMPGRLCGETVDADGNRGFVLTLSTREQHIRRDKATSNICTNSGLCSLAFTIHMTLLGEAGLSRLARINHANAVKLADKLAAVKGVEVLNKAFFNEFTVKLAKPAAEVVERLAEKGVLAGVPVSRLLPGAGLDNLLLVASTEVNTDDDRAAFVAALKEVL